jgi:hypothetical protein
MRLWSGIQTTGIPLQSSTKVYEEGRGHSNRFHYGEFRDLLYHYHFSIHKEKPFTITMAPFEREPRFNAATLSESSDEDNDINYEICTRKPTRPMVLDVKAKRDKFGCYMVGKTISSHNLEEDGSDSDMEDLARGI